MYPNLQSEVEGHLTNLHAHLIPGSPIRLQDPGTFTFQDVLYANAVGVTVYPNGLPIPLTNQARSSIRYMIFSVSVNARQAYTGEAVDVTAAGLSTKLFNRVAVQLPAVGNLLHPTLDAVALSNPTLTQLVIQGIQAGSPPALGYFGRDRNMVEIRQDRFNLEFKEYVAQCHYSASKILIRKEFLGT